ncbi:MAG: DUF7662 domain-containing protein [Oscillospiraceae bacterium]
MNNNDKKGDQGMAMTNNLNSSVLPVAEQASSMPASMRDAFSEWLSDGNVKKFSPQATIACLDKISEYVKSKKISCGLWEISRLSIFKPVYQKVMDAKLLRIMDRNTYKTFQIAGQLYIKFLKEKPWEAIADEEPTTSFASVLTMQDKKNNLTTSTTNDESLGTNRDVIQIIEDFDFKYVDKRDLGGALWVLGGLDLSDAMQTIAKHGYHFKFKVDGGRSSDYQSAWWYKPADSLETSKIEASELTQNENDQVKRIDESSDESNSLKIGLYIRNTLRQLSESGFVFSEQQLRDICDLKWSKATFGLATPHPFARIVDGSAPVSDLTKDERGYNRYWNETFAFGTVDLLFTSQWYERNRDYFDKWLSALNSGIGYVADNANQESSYERKYDPLKQWLIENGNEKIRISFSEIADLVGELPPSAYKHRAFWSNTDSHSFSTAWIEAGYKAVDCDLKSQYVRFVKDSSVDPNNNQTRLRKKTVKAALIEFSNNSKGKIKTRKDIVEELSTKYGHNRNSILPADYEIGLNNDLPKLFRRIDHGTYVCLGCDLTRPEAVMPPCITADVVSDADKEKVIKVIATKFKNGFRKSSSIDFERFKNFYNDEYGEEFHHDTEWVNRLLATEALVFDDRAYIYDENIVTSVLLYLKQADSPCMFIDAFFNKYSSEFYTFNIFSVEMLRAFIEKNYHDILVKRDYILLQDNISPSDLIKEVFGEREMWSFDELQERLPWLKIDTIQQTMNGSDYFRVDKGTYIHIDNIDLPDSEGEKIASFVEDKLRERDYVTANELDLSMFENLNPHCSFAAVRDAVFSKFLSDKYEKSGQVITKIGNKLRVLDIMEQYCREAETVSFEELNAFEATFDPEGRTHSQCLIAGHNTMIRVSAGLFVSESNVNFDAVHIDEAIALYCHGDFIPLRGVTDFSLFTFAGYPWNLYLLESYVRRFSRVFKYDVRAVNSANIGVIVRKSFDYNNYDDILALALAKSLVKLSDKKAVGNYLFDKGYIGWRNLGKSESKIIKSAKALREGGAV